MGRPRLLLNTILGVVIAAGACSYERPAATEPGMTPALGGLLGNLTLLSCAPLPAASNSAVIGPRGGSLTVGPHTLVVPPNALSQEVLISATAPSDTVNTIRFEPAGLVFRQPVALTLSFANCSSLPLLRPGIVYTDDAFNLLERITSLVNTTTKSVTGGINHFSQYAVAY